MRSIWLDGNGNGDPSPTLFERIRYTHDGHPTWKIYCGDAPKRENGILIEPPRFCYLDDATVHRIAKWDGYSKSYKGRCWRFDFGSKGKAGVCGDQGGGVGGAREEGGRWRREEVCVLWEREEGGSIGLCRGRALCQSLAQSKLCSSWDFQISAEVHGLSFDIITYKLLRLSN